MKIARIKLEQFDGIAFFFHCEDEFVSIYLWKFNAINRPSLRRWKNRQVIRQPWIAQGKSSYALFRNETDRFQQNDEFNFLFSQSLENAVV